MSTSDVPGAKASNRDELSMGCWAEHDDGSLIFVESTEGGRVVYMIFDIAADPPVEYRDAMNEQPFKKKFSWAGDKKKDKWTWHDKTPFPWDRIIDAGTKSGVGFASADHLETAAKRVAQSRKLRGKDLDPSDWEHMTPREKAGHILDRIQDALDGLGV